MQHDTTFAVRYLTDDPVPIRDIIESLQGVETVLGEMAYILPKLIDGVQVQRVTVRVREISQESPLRELFLVSLILAFQRDLEREVVTNVQAYTGYHIPENWDTIVTVLAMVVVFYGAGAIKDLVMGRVTPGATERVLADLIDELAHDTGKTPVQIRQALDARYGDKTLWKRIANATSRFFGPSKKQNAAMEVNEREIERETVQEIPAHYLIEDASDSKPARSFSDVLLELHAQDRDHSGKGWAAIPKGVSDDRLRLKLMEGVSTVDLWGHDTVRGDITVVYEKVGLDMIPKEIHLHSIRGADDHSS